MSRTATVTNFGRNVRFTPSARYEPRSEEELLAILEKHDHGHIRVVGARHAWSAGIETDDALVDLRHFDRVSVRVADGRPVASVGGGCRIKTLLKALQAEGLTTPSVGLVTEQSIAGAIATATHGSGKQSLSHFVRAVRVAAYDAETGAPEIHTINSGPELLAARCSLGCMGVVVEVELECVPQYFVREKATACATIGDVLALEARAPLQQFFLIPHLGSYYAQERAVAAEARPSRSAWAYQIYWFLFIDLALHVCIKACLSLFRSRAGVRFLYRRLLPLVISERWVVTDRSDRILVMEHELFRHLEQEVFVPSSELEAASAFVAEVIEVFDGTREDLSEDWRARLGAELHAELVGSRGSFSHHYPICFRRVLADDTLLSMSSGHDDCWYAISFITYAEPREPFYGLARFLAKSMSRLFRARPHWGKWFPLGVEEVASMYPELEQFRRISRRFDPNGVFLNEVTERILGLAQGPKSS